MVVTGAMNVFNDAGFNPEVLNLSATAVTVVCASVRGVTITSSNGIL